MSSEIKLNSMQIQSWNQSVQNMVMGEGLSSFKLNDATSAIAQKLSNKTELTNDEIKEATKKHFGGNDSPDYSVVLSALSTQFDKAATMGKWQTKAATKSEDLLKTEVSEEIRKEIIKAYPENKHIANVFTNYKTIGDIYEGTKSIFDFREKLVAQGIIGKELGERLGIDKSSLEKAENSLQIS